MTLRKRLTIAVVVFIVRLVAEISCQNYFLKYQTSNTRLGTNRVGQTPPCGSPRAAQKLKAG